MIPNWTALQKSHDRQITDTIFNLSCTQIMSNITKDIGEIYSRLFDCRPFLTGELQYFVNEFEEKRQDREIEGLFTTLQNTIELRDSSLERSQLICANNLSELSKNLKTTLSACENIIDEDFERLLAEKLENNRRQRKQEWTQFVDDMTHKCSRVDNTFEEKKEELRELYSDLEQKLHIHK